MADGHNQEKIDLAAQKAWDAIKNDFERRKRAFNFKVGDKFSYCVCTPSGYGKHFNAEVIYVVESKVSRTLTLDIGDNIVEYTEYGLTQNMRVWNINRIGF